MIAAALDEVRARPRHLALAGTVAGLLAGPRGHVVLFACVIAGAAAAGRPHAALVVAACVVMGALGAQARIHALDRTTLASWLGHAVDLRVTQLEPARRRSFGAHDALARVESGPGRGERVLVHAPGGVRWPTGARPGVRVRVRGGLRTLKPFEAYLRPRTVHAVVAADAIVLSGPARGGLFGFVDRVREHAEDVLAHGPPPAQAALLRGMVLGEDEALPDEMRKDFRATGLSHLVAASGQNVMLLGALALGIGMALGLRLRTRLGLVLALIALYVPLAGAGPSIQRAGVMGAAGVAATLAGRPASRWYAVLLAAAVTLAWNPRSVEEPGWQLSFAAVIAMLLLAPRLSTWLRARHVPPGLAEACALTGAATIGTAPLMAAHFEQASLVSLPANVLVEPVVAPIMWLGMTAAAVGQVAPALAAPLVGLAVPPLGFVSWVAQAGAEMPGSGLRVPAPGALGVALLYALPALLLVVRSRLKRARRRGTVGGMGGRLALSAVLVLTAIVILRGGPSGGLGPPPGLRISFLDVGQGDATLVQDREAAMLVDTGPPDGPILERLRHAGIRRLDALVVTHAQADHEGGAAAVLGAMPVSVLLDGRDGVRSADGSRFAAAAARRHVHVVAPEPGEVVRAGQLSLRVLSPAPRVAAPSGGDPNERAIVAEVEDRGFRLLLTADAESDVTGSLPLEPVDVLKVAHHGSSDDGLPQLLARIRPRVAVISVGRHNVYGHPAQATVEALQATVPEVLRTDRDGTVRIDVAAGRLAVRTHA